MASDSNELTGPDLANGIETASLSDSKPLLGHLRGEPVVVVRCEGSVYAVAAQCTHYSGPLDQGLVVGCMIHCPLHHAAFDLRTGEPIRPPALNPLPTYEVTEKGGRISFGEKRERDPLAPVGSPKTAGHPSSIVIVGGGAAGSAASEMLRRQGYIGPITVVDLVASEPVDRPNLSKDFLAGTASEDWIPLRPDGFYRDHRIDRLNDEVLRIDRNAHAVSLKGGRTLAYDRLLLAPGASPIRLDIPGNDLSHVHTLRTFEDARAIAAGAQQAKHAVVIGSSFIGMEGAAALASRGITVHVVSMDAVPFERTLGAELGKAIQQRFEQHGVVFHLGRKPARITSTSVELDDGVSAPADLVIMGVGVRPRLALARDAGLEVGDGVVVDEFLASSDPKIFAAGDIAAWPDPHTGERIRAEHWEVAEHQGQVAARNMLGQRQPFTAVPFFWSSFIGMDYTINYVGHGLKGDTATTPGGAGGEGVTEFRSGDRIHAVVTVANDRASLLAEQVIAAEPTRRRRAPGSDARIDSEKLLHRRVDAVRLGRIVRCLARREQCIRSIEQGIHFLDQVLHPTRGEQVVGR